MQGKHHVSERQGRPGHKDCSSAGSRQCSYKVQPSAATPSARHDTCIILTGPTCPHTVIAGWNPACCQGGQGRRFCPGVRRLAPEAEVEVGEREVRADALVVRRQVPCWTSGKHADAVPAEVMRGQSAARGLPVQLSPCACERTRHSTVDSISYQHAVFFAITDSMASACCR